MLSLALCLFALWNWSSTSAAENRVVLNIEPTPQFPRNSEGAFVTLKNGRILFFYTRFYGGRADHSAAQIVSIHSDDGGSTWSAPPRVVVANRGDCNVMSVSLLRMQSGRIGLFYLLKNSWIDCRPYLQISSDEAETWSEPRLVGTAPGYFVLNNDRVLQLRNGRLCVPLAFHRSRDTDPNSSRSFDSRAITMWYLSDDEGKTWREAETWWALPAHGRTGLQEPGVVELANGELFGWARTDQGKQFGFRSKDGARTWTAPEATPLISPVSPASIKRLPASNVLLAVYNDHSGQFPFPSGKRTPLVAALSSDNGVSWPKRRILEEDPDGWYCYTAIHFVEESALLAYCAGDSTVGGLNRLRIRRVALDWLRGE